MSVSRITIQDGKMSMIFDFREISHIIFKNYSSTCRFINGKEIIINTTFSKLKDLLPSDLFIMIENEIILNKKEIRSITNHEFESEIILKSGKSVFLSTEKRKLISYFNVI